MFFEGNLVRYKGKKAQVDRIIQNGKLLIIVLDEQAKIEYPKIVQLTQLAPYICARTQQPCAFNYSRYGCISLVCHLCDIKKEAMFDAVQSNFS